MADDKVIHFNKDDYDKLIKMIGDDQADLEAKFLSAHGGMQLDEYLPTFLHPGSADWHPCGAIIDGAKAFGGSVAEKLGNLNDDWTSYLKALKGVSDVFTNCSDLATMSAQDFTDKYPDFSGGFGSGGGSGSGSGNGN